MNAGLPRQFRQRMIQIEDLIKQRPEKIVLPAIPPLLREHRNLLLKASSRTQNFRVTIKSICNKIDRVRSKVGKIRHFQKPENLIQAGGCGVFMEAI
jgi:hypothetical protein